VAILTPYHIPKQAAGAGGWRFSVIHEQTDLHVAVGDHPTRAATGHLPDSQAHARIATANGLATNFSQRRERTW
jgi:hypothetical protein